MLASTVASQMASMFTIMLCGYILAKVKILNDHAVQGLSVVLANLGMPAIVLASTGTELSPETLRQLGVSFGGIFVIFLIAVCATLLVCCLLKIPMREAGVWVCCVAFGNNIFFGKPILMALYHDKIAFAVAATSLPFSILLYSVGVYFVRGHAKMRVRDVFRLLCNVPVVASVVALALFFFSVQPPQFFLNACNMAGSSTTPIAMVIIGYSLAQADLREIFYNKKTYLVALLRLVIVPLICFLIFRGFVHDTMLLGFLLVTAAMPVGSLIGVLSKQYDNQPVFASTNIFVTTLLSGITIPLLVYLLL